MPSSPQQREQEDHRWRVRQAPYLPQCGSLAAAPHASRLAKLPQREQFAAVELFPGNMLRHNLILCRDDQPGDNLLPRFDGDGWPGYVPIRLPETKCLQKKLPPGAVAVLINPAHTHTDIVLPVDASELRLIDAIDGRRSIDEIIQESAPSGSGSLRQLRERARSLFERLYWFDQVVFQTLARDLR